MFKDTSLRHYDDLIKGESNEDLFLATIFSCLKIKNSSRDGIIGSIDPALSTSRFGMNCRYAYRFFLKFDLKFSSEKLYLMGDAFGGSSLSGAIRSAQILVRNTTGC